MGQSLINFDELDLTSFSESDLVEFVEIASTESTETAYPFEHILFFDK